MNKFSTLLLATVLALLGLVTFVAKTIVEWRMRKETEMLTAELPPEKTELHQTVATERAANLDLSLGRMVWFKPRQAKVFAASVALAPATKQPFLL